MVSNAKNCLKPESVPLISNINYQANICSKSTIETLEKGMKYVQS